MAAFTGYRDHRIDGKDRVVIPAPYAGVVQAESQGRLFLVPGAEAPCLEAYPARVFEELAGRHVPDRFEGSQSSRRVFFHLAEEVQLKGPGRVTLPRRYLRYFPKRVVRVAGMNRYLELWDPDLWEEHVGRALGSFPQPGPEVGT